MAWFPITRGGKYEKDYYPIIRDELSEEFGDTVYEQQAVAHGTILKIDFHVGEPQGLTLGASS